jgi:hypothetical protein
MTTTSHSPEHSEFARRIGLDDTIERLRADQDRKCDEVVPARNLYARGGRLMIRGAGEPVLGAHGVTTPLAGEFVISPTFEQGIADKLKIPQVYLRRIREAGRTDLFDRNVNAWLEETPDTKYLVRCWRGHHGGPGVARALLSDTYKIINNYDLMLATLDGLRQVKGRFDITTDLSERRMYVRIRARDITAAAPYLVHDYRSPLGTRAYGRDEPLVDAGAIILNSEVGASRYSISPHYVFRVCTNGMTIVKDAKNLVHRGERLPAGIVTWSDDTRRAEMNLVAKKTRDTVRTFLDVDFMLAKLHDVARDAGIPITDPAATLEHVATKNAYTDTEAATILAHFTTGADLTAGGVLHAVTSTAQTLQHPDRAAHLEATALDAMALAGTFRP